MHRRSASFQRAGSLQLDSAGLPRSIMFDFVRPEEVRAAHALEVEGFPPEDAASYEKLLARARAAPHLFLGAFIPLPPPKVAGPLSVSGPQRRKIVAFITGTAAPALTLRSMSHHDTSEDAHMVCIHSVVVSPEYQKKGLAVRMLENYIARIRKAEEGRGPDGEAGKRGYETLALLAHEELTVLYKKVGFRVRCHSHIQYGSGSWLEMRRSLYPSPSGSSSTTSSRIGTGLERTTSATSSAGPDLGSPVEPQMSHSAPASTDTPQSTSKQATPADSTASSSTVVPLSTPTPAPVSASAPVPASSPDVPPGMPSQASILAALAAQSKPGKSPGVTYTSILGQAVAAKTAAEDAGLALEARLVNRDDGTNLARLYCPQENCRCCILAKGAGEWTRKESGPLSNPALELPNSPPPPQGPAFPVHAASASVSHRLLTSVKGFWVVDGPLQFDNVGFSRDMKWTVPMPAEVSSPRLLGRNGSGDGVSGSESGGGPRTKAQEKEAKDRQRREEKERAREEKERKKEQKAREKRERAERKRNGSNGGGSGSESNASDEDVSSLLAHLSLGLTPGEELTVKYLLCPDCECGPLGFSILPADMQDGKLAAQVGDQVERMKGGTLDPANVPKRPPQLFYLAADRVRYQFERS
ncbi:Mss4-like protein [Testicularia cyperi]|uniref:Mss4-like protein n=1 Tax=Testicularia cyperi TaxID=1882483 RepID=A0A317XXB3_9BASI|nr:Mss4-like protein [Testicularia cyperi]